LAKNEIEGIIIMSDSNKEEGTTPAQPTEETEQQPVVHTEVVESEVEQEKPEIVPAAAKKQEEEKEEEKEPGEEEIEVVEEKIYTIPISKLGYTSDRGHRAPRAVSDVRAYVSRHMKADEVALSNEINEAIWGRGINKPPRKITVRAVKDKEGKVVVYPAKTA
jgi:large subunit ribosomal protein L31e